MSTRETEPAPDLGWHVLSGEVLLAMLRRVHIGEDPEFMFIEFWANTEHDSLSGGDVEVE